MSTLDMPLDVDSDDDREKQGSKPTTKDLSRRMSTSTSKSRVGSTYGNLQFVESDTKTKKSQFKPKEDKSRKPIKQFERNINKKVIVIQRFVRGYLARKLFKRLKRLNSIPKLFKEFIQEGEVICNH